MTFYQQRRQLGYYQLTRSWLDSLGPRESILDVGCWDSPVATWGDFRRRYTVDTRDRPELPGVTKMIATWPEVAATLRDPVSVVTCLQVIEHILDVQPFVEALFAVADQYVVISVPYCWPAGMCRYHVHDPIDEAKLAWMTRRKPWRTLLATEKPARMLAIYEQVRHEPSLCLPQ